MNWLRLHLRRLAEKVIAWTGGEVPRIRSLEDHADALQEASRAIVAQSMGERPFTYDMSKIQIVYNRLDKGTNFERLVQLFNSL